MSQNFFAPSFVVGMGDFWFVVLEYNIVYHIWELYTLCLEIVQKKVVEPNTKEQDILCIFSNICFPFTKH